MSSGKTGHALMTDSRGQRSTDIYYQSMGQRSFNLCWQKKRRKKRPMTVQTPRHNADNIHTDSYWQKHWYGDSTRCCLEQAGWTHQAVTFFFFLPLFSYWIPRSAEGNRQSQNCKSESQIERSGNIFPANQKKINQVMFLYGLLGVGRFVCTSKSNNQVKALPSSPRCLNQLSGEAL